MTGAPQGAGDLDARLDRALVGGRRPASVVLVEPDPAWPARFEAERAVIGAALGGRALAMHHIGSTAVPGLLAKDRVDVCVEVADPGDEPAWLPDLLAAGYVVRVVEPGHRCLVHEDPATNVHVYAAGAPEVNAYLTLRDRLRVSHSDRELYARVKCDLAARGEWADVNHYAEAKGDVIREILSRA